MTEARLLNSFPGDYHKNINVFDVVIDVVTSTDLPPTMKAVTRTCGSSPLADNGGT